MDLCVGIDTGLPHVAASFGVPVVSLHGHTDPRQWRPWKTASVIVQPADGTRSMEGITVDQVIAAADRLIDETGAVHKARRRGVRTIDLRAVGYRYEAVESAGIADKAPSETQAVGIAS